MKEKEFIRKLSEKFPLHSKLLIKGIGDDCAVFGNKNNSHEWLISTDLLVENVHFVIDWHDPYLLGRKCVAVNLSDIAAMGGEPLFILFSLSIPKHIDDQWLNRWQDGAASIMQQYNCDLIGGDTTKGEILTINVIILGRCRKEEIIYRSNARVGQDIYVTGLLGSAAAGLEILRRDVKTSGRFQELVDAHLNPEPQLRVGRFLAQNGLAGAMQDISDGLSTDLSHICEASSVGAVVRAKELPYSQDIIEISSLYSIDFLDFVLNGGEDYQLVFTADKNSRETLRELAETENLFIKRIGEISAAKGVFLEDADGNRRDITFCGFEHTN